MLWGVFGNIQLMRRGALKILGYGSMGPPTILWQLWELRRRQGNRAEVLPQNNSREGVKG